MTSANPPTIVVSNRDLRSLPEWQHAVDAQEFLVAFRLVALNVEAGTPSLGRFGDRPVAFLCERRRIEDVLGAPRGDGGAWTFAYAFRGLGTMLESAAANMVALGYAVSTNGAFFRAARGLSTEFAHTKFVLDTALSVALERTDLFALRYPDEAVRDAAGPGQVLSRPAD